MNSLGALGSPFFPFDLVRVFRNTVELGTALDAYDAIRNEAAPGNKERIARFQASLDADRVADTAADRLLCALNPHMSSAPDWSRQLDLADASPDARDALRTLGLALADIRGDWEERGRELLGEVPGTSGPECVLKTVQPCESNSGRPADCGTGRLK